MRFGRLGVALGLLGLFAPPTAAQDVTLHGQIRPRYEFRDPSGTGGRDEFTSMRVRLTLDAELESGLTFFVQFQDVRLWGEELNTLGDFRADNFDLHQAWFRYQGRELEWLRATIGRQETVFGGQRLVGAVDWTQQGRAFDGIRLDLTSGRRRVALIAYTLADATAPAHAADAELFGAYATLGEIGPGGLDLYWLYDRGEGAARTGQSTFGARYAFDDGGVSGRLEGSLQRGDRAGESVAATMLGARVGTSVAEGRLKLTAWYDRLSGDADPADGENGTFSTLYATNHKFYGFADLFLDIPAHTGGRGLQDLALKASWSATETATLGVDLHRFSAVEDRGLSTTHFGDEVDVTLSHRYTRNLTGTVGASFIRQADALAEIGRLREDLTWVYVMFDVVF